MDKASSEDHLHDRFYQGLRITETPWGTFMILDTYNQILKAARTAEAEADNFKEVETSKSVKESDPAVLGKWQAMKAEVKKIWNQSPNQNQQKKSGGPDSTKNKDKNNNTYFRYGGIGHQRFKLPAGGKEEGQGPPSTTVQNEVSTSTMDHNPDSETAEP